MVGSISWPKCEGMIIRDSETTFSETSAPGPPPGSQVKWYNTLHPPYIARSCIIVVLVHKRSEGLRLQTLRRCLSPHLPSDPWLQLHTIIFILHLSSVRSLPRDKCRYTHGKHFSHRQAPKKKALQHVSDSVPRSTTKGRAATLVFSPLPTPSFHPLSLSLPWAH